MPERQIQCPECGEVVLNFNPRTTMQVDITSVHVEHKAGDPPSHTTEVCYTEGGGVW